METHALQVFLCGQSMPPDTDNKNPWEILPYQSVQNRNFWYDMVSALQYNQIPTTDIVRVKIHNAAL